jgi:phosphate/sulfate permease
MKQAVLAAGICEFLGALLVGARVADTIKSGIVVRYQIVTPICNSPAFATFLASLPKKKSRFAIEHHFFSRALTD